MIGVKELDTNNVHTGLVYNSAQLQSARIQSWFLGACEKRFFSTLSSIAIARYFFSGVLARVQYCCKFL